MKILRINKSRIISSTVIILILNIVLLLFYNGLGNVYFQQDEWHALGKTIYYVNANFIDIFTRKFAFHYIPVTNIYFVIEYLLFKTESKYYLFFGIFLQSITGFSFYILLKKIFNNSAVAFAGAVLFITNFEVSQVILVEMVSFYTLSLLFVNILFIKLYDVIASWSQTKIADKTVVVFLFILAILTHEAWFALIVLIPLFILMFRFDKHVFNWGKSTKYIVVFAVFFIFFRLVLQIVLPMDGKIPPQPSEKLAIAHSLATLPFKSTMQYAIGYGNIFSLSKFYQNKMSYYRNDKTLNQDLMATTMAYDMVVYYISAAVLVLLLIILSICKTNIGFKNRYIKAIIFGVGWIVAMSVVMSMQKRFFNSIDSRYMYLFSEGIVVLMVSLPVLVANYFKNVMSAKFFVVVIALFYIVTFGYYSYFQIQKTEKSIIEVSRVRVNIINQIKKISPSLSDRTIVYLKCSDDCTSNSRFGMPNEWIVPFQNGFGWTLLVAYSEKDAKKYAQFFSRDTFLWERGATGYKEVNNIGYGFFTDASQLKLMVSKYKLNTSNILGLEYESKKYNIKKMSNLEINELLNSKLL